MAIVWLSRKGDTYWRSWWFRQVAIRSISGADPRERIHRKDGLSNAHYAGTALLLERESAKTFKFPFMWVAVKSSVLRTKKTSYWQSPGPKRDWSHQTPLLRQFTTDELSVYSLIDVPLYHLHLLRAIHTATNTLMLMCNEFTGAFHWPRPCWRSLKWKPHPQLDASVNRSTVGGGVCQGTRELKAYSLSQNKSLPEVPF